jgi:hypothetical protein
MKQENGWANRIWQEFRAGNLTPTWRDVLTCLHGYRGAGGVAWPSHDTLADRARCDPRTVRRALEAARDLGLVAWTARRVRVGWRSLRSSNCYRFLRPEAAVESTPGRRRPCARLLQTGAVRAVLAGLRTAGLFGRGPQEKEQGRAFEGASGTRLSPHPPIRTVAEQLELLRAGP